MEALLSLRFPSDDDFGKNALVFGDAAQRLYFFLEKEVFRMGSLVQEARGKVDRFGDVARVHVQVAVSPVSEDVAALVQVGGQDYRKRRVLHLLRGGVATGELLVGDLRCLHIN